MASDPVEPAVPLTKPVVSESLSESLNKTLKKVPDSRKGFLEVDATLEGAEVEFGHKFSQDWVIGAYAAKPWKGEFRAGVRLRGAW